MMTMRDIHKGTIVKLHREPVTGTSYLEINDVDEGPTLIVCQGTPTAKAFDKVFGGVIVDGRFNGTAEGEPGTLRSRVRTLREQLTDHGAPDLGAPPLSSPHVPTAWNSSR